LSSYLRRIKRKENSSCSACGYPLQDLTHLLLNCPASEPLMRAIFGTTSSIVDLWSRPLGMARLLVSVELPHAPISRRGQVAPSPPPPSLALTSLFLMFKFFLIDHLLIL